jgi:hypothetical protein
MNSVITEFPPSPSNADRIGLCVPRSTQCVCGQALPLRVNAQAAPAGPTKGDRPRSAFLGPGPPMMAVLLPADSATDMPRLAFPTALVLTSFGLCWKTCAGASCPRRIAPCRARSASSAARAFGSLEKPASVLGHNL